MKKLLSLLTAVLLVGTMWAEDYDEDIAYADMKSGSMLSGNYTDASSYYKVPGTAGNTATVTIPSSYFENQPNDDVTIILHLATFGQGTNPSTTNTTITATGTEASSTWTTSTYTGSLPSSSTYTNITLTLPKVQTPSQLAGVAINISVTSSIKIFRLDNITIQYSYTAGSCTKSISLKKAAEAPSNGSFSLTNSGNSICIDEGNASTTVNAIPNKNYHLATVSSLGDDGETTVGSVGVIDVENSTCEITGIDANTTISVTFAEDANSNVTWNNNGATSTSKVYHGNKPVFPATPVSFDATSTSFYGWATAAWSGVAEDLESDKLDDITIYRKASAMPAVTGPVTYYAVFAKKTVDETWSLIAISSIGSEDVIVFADQDNYALTNDKGTGNAVGAKKLTVVDDEITNRVADSLKWNVTGNSTDGYTFYQNGSTTNYLYCSTTASSGSNNNMRVGSSGQRKVFTINASGYFVTKDTYTLRYVCRYDNSDFRGYINLENGVPMKNPKFYKLTDNSTYAKFVTTKDSETSLETVESSAKAVKTIVNGQLFIEKNGHIYNAQGQLVK